jgi:hypothetical protein
MMPKESHRLARAVEPRPEECNTAEKHAVVSGGDLLGVPAGGTYCGCAKDRTGADAGTVPEQPLDGVLR